MAKREINAVEWTCDSPTCEEVEMVAKSEGNGPPKGWITGTSEKGHVGPVDWVVHHTKCTRPAIEQALADADERQHAETPNPQGDTP